MGPVSHFAGGHNHFAAARRVAGGNGLAKGLGVHDRAAGNRPIIGDREGPIREDSAFQLGHGERSFDRSNPSAHRLRGNPLLQGKTGGRPSRGQRLDCGFRPRDLRGRERTVQRPQGFHPAIAKDARHGHRIVQPVHRGKVETFHVHRRLRDAFAKQGKGGKAHRPGLLTECDQMNPFGGRRAVTML